MCVSNVGKPRTQKRERAVFKVFKTNKEWSFYMSIYNYYYFKTTIVNHASKRIILDDDDKYFFSGFCCFTRKKDAVLFQKTFNEYYDTKNTVLKKAYIPKGTIVKNATETCYMIFPTFKVPCIISNKLIIK